MGELRKIVWGLVLLVLAVGAIGCGEDTSTGAGETADAERLYPWIEGPSREFIIPNGDNIVQGFGEEASVAEREEASKVIHAWMKVRVAEDWATFCTYLARKYVENLLWDARGVTRGKVKSCRGALEYFGDNASGTSGNTLTGPIDSLRVKGPDDVETEWEAWAQWHGPKGKDWVLPLKREKGVWKISSASPLDRTK